MTVKSLRKVLEKLALMQLSAGDEPSHNRLVKLAKSLSVRDREQVSAVVSRVLLKRADRGNLRS